MNKANFSVTGSQQPRIRRDPRPRRYWPPWLAVIALACGSPTPIHRAAGGAQGVAVDAGVDGDAEVDAGEALTSWCSVQAVFALKCQRCHASPTTHGAPFSLVSYDDTQVLDKKDNPRFERIAAVVEQGIMPAQYIKLEPPVEALQDDERATILSWCAQGGVLTGSANCEP